MLDQSRHVKPSTPAESRVALQFGIGSKAGPLVTTPASVTDQTIVLPPESTHSSRVLLSNPSLTSTALHPRSGPKTHLPLEVLCALVSQRAALALLFQRLR